MTAHTNPNAEPDPLPKRERGDSLKIERMEAFLTAQEERLQQSRERVAEAEASGLTTIEPVEALRRAVKKDEQTPTDDTRPASEALRRMLDRIYFTHKDIHSGKWFDPMDDETLVSEDELSMLPPEDQQFLFDYVGYLREPSKRVSKSASAYGRHTATRASVNNVAGSELIDR